MWPPREQAFDQWGPDVGIEFVYANDTCRSVSPNGLAPEVTAMKEAGVDFITLCIDQNGALTLEQELNRQGMADIPVLLPQGYADTEFVEANAELLEGDVLSLFSRPFEANQEGTLVPEMIEWIDAGGYKMNDQAIQGWINADMAVTGLLAAGPQFDRDSVIQATNAITAYDASGVVPTIDWTKQHTRYTGETMLTDGPLPHLHGIGQDRRWQVRVDRQPGRAVLRVRQQHHGLDRTDRVRLPGGLARIR